eukprot:6127208-Pyramimonas_sp.AAC.2
MQRATVAVRAATGADKGGHRTWTMLLGNCLQLRPNRLASPLWHGYLRAQTTRQEVVGAIVVVTRPKASIRSDTRLPKASDAYWTISSPP